MLIPLLPSGALLSLVDELLLVPRRAREDELEHEWDMRVRDEADGIVPGILGTGRGCVVKKFGERVLESRREE